MIFKMSAADKSRLIDTLILAFVADPFVRWMLPQADKYQRVFPAMVQIVADAAVDTGSAYHTNDFTAAAIWLTPGTQPNDDDFATLLKTEIDAAIRDDVFDAFEKMGNFQPDPPCWKLPLIGTDPPRQGQGHGNALLAETLRKCDAAGLPAHLESTNPANVPLYRRHGFEIIGEIHAGSSPVVYPMRRPRRA